MLCTIFE